MGLSQIYVELLLDGAWVVCTHGSYVAGCASGTWVGVHLGFLLSGNGAIELWVSIERDVAVRLGGLLGLCM